MLYTYSYIFSQGLIKIMTSDPSHLWYQAGTLNVLSHRHLYHFIFAILKAENETLPVVVVEAVR